METAEKPWRDMYYFFKEQFEYQIISQHRIIFSDELKCTAVELNEWLREQNNTSYTVEVIERILERYFEYSNGRYIIKKSTYFLLVHEIHNPELPAEMLPFNYKRSPAYQKLT